MGLQKAGAASHVCAGIGRQSLRAWDMPSRTEESYGRGDELTRFLQLADQASQGSPRSLLIRGDAGIGKSRLVSDAADVLRRRGGLVVVGHGVELSGGELPFGVLADTLRDIVRQVGVDEVRRKLGADSSSLAPLVAALRSGPRAEPNRSRVITTTTDLF